jgi:predicted nucleotidyltransferase
MELLRSVLTLPGLAMNSAIEGFRTRLRTELPMLSVRYHVASLGLFGSYLRGTQKPESDLDVLVSFSAVPSLLRFVELENYLSDLLGVKVDLVLRESLKPAIGRRVLREVVPV